MDFFLGLDGQEYAAVLFDDGTESAVLLSDLEVIEGAPGVDLFGSPFDTTCFCEDDFDDLGDF